METEKFGRIINPINNHPNFARNLIEDIAWDLQFGCFRELGSKIASLYHIVFCRFTD